MPSAWIYATPSGTFRIARRRDGRWIGTFDGEEISNHPRPETVAEDIGGGTSFWPSCGNPALLGVPDTLDDWTLTR